MGGMQGKHLNFFFYIIVFFFFIKKVQKGAQSSYMGWQKEDPKEIKLTCTKEKLKPMRSS